MKTRALKSLLTLIFVVMALPVLSQDFMVIYLKNGDVRKFYMKNITEISASRVDTEGIQHSDYSSQCITTIYDKYVYNLEDVDSITFTKIDEQKAEENFVTAMPEVFSVIDKCETIDDVEDNIEEIKNSEGVADAWSDGHQLYVTIEEGETFSFHFSHNVDNGSFEKTSTQIRAMKPQLISVAKQKGRQLKAVIANQQEKDEYRSTDKEDYFSPLIKLFNECNIDAKYLPSPKIDFFYNNSNDPEQLNIYDYDIIILSTHGCYGPLQYYRPGHIGRPKSKDGIKGHSIMTSEELCKPIPLKSEDEEGPDEPWINKYDIFKEWRDKLFYKDVSDQHINYSWCKEERNGSECWVAHPLVTEYFFRDIAPGTFINPNSFFFNTACESVKGDKKGEPSHSFGNILMSKNLGIYAGYTEKSWFGQKCSYDLFSIMLWGVSGAGSYTLINEKYPYECYESLENILSKKEDFTETALNKTIKDSEKNEKKGLEPAKLEIWSKFGNGDFFLFPTITIKLDAELVNKDYNNNQNITLQGFTTHSKEGEPEIGFEFGETSDLSPLYRVNNTIKKQHVDNIDFGNYKFETTISNLTPGNIYYYRAYTFDGFFYNYGETYEFKIEKPEEFADLALSSTTPISLKTGESATIEITSGSGNYDIENKNPSVVSVELNGNTISITALSADVATIIVTDTKSGQTQTITVTVTASEIDPIGGTETITVNGVSFDMVKVGGGTFMMGTNQESDYFVNSKPSHQVTLSPFSLGKYEVTQELWQAVMGNNPSAFTGSKRPVETVSWEDCQEFINKLNTLTGKKFRLPTEAEWEFAAKGGNNSKDYKYSGGNDIDLVGWYVMNNDFTTQNVGQKSPNELGLYDMSGNVWEWCQDWMSLYSSESQTNPTGPSSGKHRVIRGGSFGGSEFYCEVIDRGYREPDNKNFDLGLRLALSDDPIASNALCPDDHHPHWIDLGLSSGTLWQCCNEGASKPEEYGGYYEFGEVASAPTMEQCKELIDNCASEWTSRNGVNGRKFTGSNGHSIFLPAAGHKPDAGPDYNNEGFFVNLWTSTAYKDPDFPDEECAFLLGSYMEYLLEVAPVVYTNYKCSVRPVKK